MARLWQCGFEMGHIHVFDDHDSISTRLTVSAAQARTGTYSARALSTDGAYYATVYFGSETEVYGRVCIYPVSAVGTFCFLRLRDSGGGDQLSLTRGPATGLIDLRLGGTGGAVIDSGATVITIGRWYVIEFHFDIANAGGVAEIRVDGVLDINFTGDTQSTGQANVAFWDIGGMMAGGGSACEVHNDDCVIQNTAGALNNGWPGQGGIYGLLPDGAGNYTQFTPSAGANWDCCDEVPPNDATDYVEDDTVNQIDSYTMDDLPGAGVVSCVAWWARARIKADEPGDVGLERLLRYGAPADFLGGVDNPASISWSYINFREMIDASPDTAAAWTVAEVNSLESGFRRRT